MKTNFFLSVISVLVLFVIACGCDKKHDKVVAFEDKFYTIAPADVSKEDAQAMVTEYVTYADTYPEDSMTPVFLDKAAMVSIDYLEASQAANLYKRLERNYPEYTPTPQLIEMRVDTLEDRLFSGASGSIDKTRAKQLLNTYVTYYYLFPEDSLTPEYLFRAADMSMNLFSAGKSISLFNKVLENYPDYRKAPQCLFLKAFVYENNLNDLDNAKKYYAEFIEKYPNDDFADDAQMSLKNLGKTPEELIREFEAANQ
ncbi:MAG: tetratricopeptide repeat protein [Bacteroidales bacterium]|nr:tetratricopeptide repeat protein [Bacteroidales bacterium]MCF8344952.1 tetratricopeptide repeat protein [Bacteroidales bacterium]MCF8350696.1 tetratricopeptide repeat protein [Bacteroidales bacterium]MCF8376989.1 tetratricopeptide repeat protein [Bacteroidales bacterium]MCF8400858.1 tetratricopeptide repeat protein [Bacteroidales bacterium]